MLENVHFYNSPICIWRKDSIQTCWLNLPHCDRLPSWISGEERLVYFIWQPEARLVHRYSISHFRTN